MNSPTGDDFARRLPAREFVEGPGLDFLVLGVNELSEISDFMKDKFCWAGGGGLPDLGSADRLLAAQVLHRLVVTQRDEFRVV